MNSKYNKKSLYLTLTYWSILKCGSTEHAHRQKQIKRADTPATINSKNQRTLPIFSHFNLI
ncbi:MAG: hypothetical protein ACXADW_20780 [Candidatus Hodarchaeales archaeon]